MQSADTAPLADQPASSFAEEDDPTREGADQPFDTGLAMRYSVANIGSQAVFAMLNLALPLYLNKYYQLPSALIGLLANERSFVGALVQPLVGRLSDRIRTPLGRRRPFFLVGIPLMAASLLALALHPPVWIVITLLAIGAFFLFIASDPWMALMADLFPPAHRGRVGGFVGGFTALGFIVFSLIAGLLWQDYEPWVFGLTITVLLLTWGFTFFTVKERPLAPHVAPAVVPPRTRLDPGAYLRGILQYPEAAKYMFGAAIFWVGAGGATPFLTLFGQQALGADDRQVFLLPIAFFVSTLIFAVPAGFLADRVGKKRMMMGGLVIYAAAALVGSQSADLVQGTIALAVVGLGNAGLTVLNPLLTDLIPRRRTAEFIGIGSAIWSFAQPLGSVLAGAAVDLAKPLVGDHDAYRAAFIFAGIMGLLAAALLLRVHPERARLD